MKYNTLKNNSFLIISLILIIIMYYLITQLIFPMFSVNKMNFSIIDIIYVYVFSIISYILSNKNKLTSYFFIIVAVFSFFTIEPLGMTIEAKPLFFSNSSIPVVKAKVNAWNVNLHDKRMNVVSN